MSEATPTEAPPPVAPPDSVLLTRAQVAARLNVGIGTVRRLHRTGELPIRRVGRRAMTSPDDVVAWAKRQNDSHGPGQAS